MQSLVTVVLLAACLGFFFKNLAVMIRAAARGTADRTARLDKLHQRLLSVLVYFFGQRKVAEEGPLHRTSKHHLIIFWGFLIITIGTIEILLSGVFPGFSFALVLPAAAYHGLRWLIDLLNLLVLIAITWALFRRIVVRPRLIPMNLDAGLILGAIGALMVTHFLHHGFAMAAGTEDEAGPVSGMVAGWLDSATIGAAAFGASAALWLHLLLVLTFLNYLPFSKHIHLLGALPNIFFRNLGPRSLDMAKLDLEDENQWGVGRFEQFSWKSLLDTYACTECARCSNYCPAYATGKNLSPMQLIHDIRYEMVDRDNLRREIEALEGQLAGYDGNGHREKTPEQERLEAEIAALQGKLDEMPPMVGGRIAADTLWACTTCGACQEVCPVFIEHPLKIIQMRQNLVLEQEKVPAELARTFRNIERQSNPWGIAKEKRMDWAQGMDVPTVEDNPDAEYLLWVGCAGAFDNRIIKQTQAMVKILHAAGVNYAVLGKREACTGDPARRSGNEMLFQMQAESNVETLNAVGAKKVITSCPHCLHTLRHDYPQFGGHYEVIHHTQLLAHLFAAGKLRGEKNHIGSVTYHDSCYLGRWNREFDAPRDVLARLPLERGITELPRNRRHGFCCGAGGGRMFLEEEAPRVNTDRSEEILAAGVATVAVACPFCNIMLTDGMKEKNKEDQVKVLDVAELVADSIPDVPASSLVRNRGAAS